MPYRVTVTRRAQYDIMAIAVKLLKEAPPTRAGAWLDGLEDALGSLTEMPERCREAPESPTRSGAVIRELLYGTKPHTRRILFTVDPTGLTVSVLTVRHSRRNKARGL